MRRSYRDAVMQYIVTECDNCGERFETEDVSWAEHREEAKESGFICKKVDDRWMHFCSEECYYEYLGGNKI